MELKKQKKKESDKKYYEKNKTEYLLKCKIYRDTHKDEINKRNHKYSEKNKNKIKIKSAEYRKNNQEKIHDSRKLRETCEHGICKFDCSVCDINSYIKRTTAHRIREALKAKSSNAKIR